MTAQLETLKTMLEQALSDQKAHSARLHEYRADFNADPAPDTAAMIKRTETKIASGELRIAALEYAVTVLEAASKPPATFGDLMNVTLAVFPKAVVSEDSDGNVTIEPGYYEVPGQTELGTYNPSDNEE